MTFVYVLVFAMRGNVGEDIAALELKEYDTWESCQAAASASFEDLGRVQRYISNRYPVAPGPYSCVPKPA